MHAPLLNIARTAISDTLHHASTLDTKALLNTHPELSKPKATFVTLTLDGRLRGCIGSLVAHRTLLDDLIYNAKAAAFDDPRFYPLSLEEFLHVKIEISLLSEPETVEYKDVEDLKRQIVTGVDGIILQKGSRKATFLPQVWEQLPSFELFFSHLCQKAGLEPDCLVHHPDIKRYRVEKIT